MKTLKEIAKQLKRIADSLTIIEVALMKANGVKYTDLEGYAKDYNQSAERVSDTLEFKGDE